MKQCLPGGTILCNCEGSSDCAVIYGNTLRKAGILERAGPCAGLLLPGLCSSRAWDVQARVT